MLACGLAILARGAIDAELPPGFPFLTFFPAVILTAYWFGLRPGIVCAILSGSAAWYLYIPPARVLTLDGAQATALAFYGVVVAVDLTLIEMMRMAGQRDRRSKAAIRRLYEAQHSANIEHRREASLRIALDATKDVIEVIELDGGVSHVNDGSPARDGSGGRWGCGWPAEAAREAERALETARREGGARFEILRPGPDGAPIWWDVLVVAVADGDGRVLRFSSISRDVTQRRQIKARLFEKTFLLDMALQAADAGTWDYCVATGRVSISAETARQHGMAAEPAELDVERDWRPLAHPEDVPRVLNDLRSAVATRSRYVTEFRVPRPEGGVRWISAIGQVVSGADGRAERAVGLTFDVSARKEFELAERETLAGAEAEAELKAREAHLRSLLETVPAAMVVIDRHRKVRFFSAASERLFGYAAADVAGSDVAILVPELQRAAFEAGIAHYLRTGMGKAKGTFTDVSGRRSDGGVFPMELSVGEMRSGEEVFFTGFVTDLTERNRTRAHVRQLQDELLHVSRLSAMGEMAAALAHEINQPLCAVGNFTAACGMLLEGHDTAPIPKARGLLREAGEQAQRAGEIIRHLREFVTRGETERREEPVVELVANACILALVGARESGVEARIRHGRHGARVFVDRVQIQQVLVNLIRNACEAMQGCPRRELDIVTSDASGGMVLVTVTDTGPGVAPSVSARLFMPLVTTKPGGMGVGLSVSRSIVEAHGGSLWAGRGGSGGACFHFTLPVMGGDTVDAG